MSSELYESRRAELADLDGDGVPSYEAGGLDCDDRNPAVFPGAPEDCNGTDDDCDGRIDENAVDSVLWFLDRDHDGFGGTATVESCTAPDGYVATPGDCDDLNSDVHLDAQEVPYDGIDNDCRGGDETDLDNDGYEGTEAGGADCDDADPLINPAAVDSWLNGGSDNDCDGSLAAPAFRFGQEAWTGSPASGWAGLGLAAVGDVTGDGKADFLVGAPFESQMVRDGGAAYLVTGGEPVPLDSLRPVQAETPATGFGIIAAGPDITGDGTPEVAIAGSLWNNGTGTVWVLRLDEWSTGDTPTIDEAFATIEGRSPYDYTGAAVLFDEDINGDGEVDLVVSATGASSDIGLSDAGRIDVWKASSLRGRIVESPDSSAFGYFEGAGYGKIVQAAGDLDGDGVTDLLIGASSGDLGAVVTWGDGEVDLRSNTIFRLTGETGEEQGRAQMVGDVDGDGVRDLAFVMDSGGDVLLYTELRDGGVKTNRQHTSTVRVARDDRVETVLGVGDIDGDELEETAVIVHTESSTRLSKVAIVLGADIGPSGTVTLNDLALQAVSANPDSGIGYRATVSDDVTGDGHRDLLLGGPWDSTGGENAGLVVALPLPK